MSYETAECQDCVMRFTVTDYAGFFDHYECAINKAGTDTQHHCIKQSHKSNLTKGES